jgi:hypothetical protein
LFEETHSGASPAPNLAFLRQLDTRDNPQKGRFSRAIDTHNPYPIPIGNREREPLEEYAVDPAHRYVLKICEESHGTTRVPAPIGGLRTIRKGHIRPVEPSELGRAAMSSSRTGSRRTGPDWAAAGPDKLGPGRLQRHKNTPDGGHHAD